MQLTSLEQISFELNEAETPKRTLHDFTRRLKRQADSIIRLLSELASMNIIDICLKSPQSEVHMIAAELQIPRDRIAQEF